MINTSSWVENITISRFPAELNKNTINSITKTRENIDNALSSIEIPEEEENNYWYSINKRWTIIYTSDFWQNKTLNADLETFEIINKLVAKDKNDVYYDWDRLNADVGSYKYFWEWWYSYDKNNIYLTSIVIDWVAPNSIQEVNWKLYFTRFWELEEAWEIFSEKFLKEKSKPNPAKRLYDKLKWLLN